METPNSHTLADALDRYLAGEATLADRALVAEGIGPKRMRQLELAKLGYGPIASATPTPYEDVRAELLGRLDEKAPISWGHAHPARRRNHLAYWLAGGGVAFAVVLGFALTTGITTQAPPPAEYTTAPGEYAKVTLHDGIDAYLQPATTVRMEQRADGLVSTVTGHAVFDVTHKTTVPFSVHTGEAAVQVLGTTFSVRRYDNDSVSTITVSDGRVTVKSLTEPGARVGSVTLEKGMRATVVPGARIAVTGDGAPFNQDRWQEGELTYRSTPAREIVADLERAYNVKIILSDTTLGAEKMTWTVHVRKHALPDVIEELAAMLNARVTRQADTIIFTRGADVRRKASFPVKTLTAENRYAM